MTPAEQLVAFVRESNRIEGITREPTEDEVHATAGFLTLDALKVENVQALVSVYQPDAELRDHPTVPGVRVGNHTAPKSGPKIREELDYILYRASTNGDPWRWHVAYETLHPFTDGNGRSGRAIWLWQMTRQYGGAPLGFLHHFYYQTLERSR